MASGLARVPDQAVARDNREVVDILDKLDSLEADTLEVVLEVGLTCISPDDLRVRAVLKIPAES